MIHFRNIIINQGFVIGLTIPLIFFIAMFVNADESPITEEQNDQQFRQQIPLGMVTGDGRVLSRRVLSATRYLMTPGDVYHLQIQLGSELVTTYPLILKDDYELQIPYLGNINVSGRYFNVVRREIIKEIRTEVLVRFVSFVLQQPAVFDVFVFGGVSNPGIYTVESLSRVSDLVTVAGGIENGGSLRKVHLNREGKMRSLDLTRFSTHGDLDANPTLRPGDRVRIPRTDKLISIDGMVAYPGVFELLEQEGINNLIQFAGGVIPTAGEIELSVIRIQGKNSKLIDVIQSKWDTFVLQKGDRVRITTAMRPNAQILVQGALFGKLVAEGNPQILPTKELALLIPYSDGISVLDVLEQLGGPTPLSIPHKSTLLRAATGVQLSIDVETLWETRDRSLDLPLEPGDQLHVPMRDTNVYLGGEVNEPRVIPYQPSLNIGDYLRVSGGLTSDGKPSFTVINTDHQYSHGDLFTRPDPGSTVIAHRNSWADTKEVIGQMAIVVGLVTAVVTLVDKIITVSEKVRN